MYVLVNCDKSSVQVAVGADASSVDPAFGHDGNPNVQAAELPDGLPCLDSGTSIFLVIVRA